MLSGVVCVEIASFGYDKGPFAKPADITLDLRRHIIATDQLPDAERFTGLHPDISGMVLESSGTRRLIDNIAKLVVNLVEDEAGARLLRLRIAIGCERGVHQSPAVAEELAATLRTAKLDIEVWHRDVPRFP
ncbi:RapZ C-terminal domain-containing protein [Streptomyces silvisoli]|uniref:RNase adapter RapZ n=1 Tax=Streptomyces silvisoli TaxID=3034235 RepID=A0ABT5ZS84_9ACTN|nr:RNase adapter RapZ [Streptomyces silvisoli]MDF3292692.1 RNase adapter RapZ [Streptomyces silvisoli]